MSFAINENSIPKLDEWGWDLHWGCEDWIAWHKAVKSKKGKAVADKIFVEWWTKDGSPKDCRTFHTGFRKYFKEEGLMDAIYGGAFIVKPFGAANDVISSASNTASSVGIGLEKAGESAEKVGDTLKWLLPTVLVAGVLVVGYVLYKNYSKSTA